MNQLSAFGKVKFQLGVKIILSGMECASWDFDLFNHEGHEGSRRVVGRAARPQNAQQVAHSSQRRA